MKKLWRKLKHWYWLRYKATLEEKVAYYELKLKK